MPRVGSSRIRMRGAVSSHRADQHLLLVAAAQVLNRLEQARVSSRARLRPAAARGAELLPA